jgi:toxin ParE1/3/4
MNSYIIAPETMNDLEQIIDYLAMDNVNKGENFLNEFNKKCRYLTQFPMMGRSYREIRSYLRDLPMKKHIIFYIQYFKLRLKILILKIKLKRYGRFKKRKT